MTSSKLSYRIEVSMEILLYLVFCLVVYMLFRKKDTTSEQTYKPSSSIPERRIYGHESDGDSPATFTISYGYDEEKSKNKSIGRWVKPQESIIVFGHTITGGNFYFGGQLKSLDEYGTEASLIDGTLKIHTAPDTFEDESLGYWPKFISLSPKCRGAYLSWLAGDQSNPKTPLGYVFIYFYGIERRIVVDSKVAGVDDPEYIQLFDEIKRLIDIYGESRSFMNYGSRLLALMCLFRPNIVSMPEKELSPRYDSILFKYQLATEVNAGNPISSELALAWIRFFPEYNLRTPARRCEKEFSQLFQLSYGKKHNEGLIVKPNKTRLKLEYWPASSSLRGVEIEQEDLPDPSNLKAPLKKLISIADQSTEELDAYSRYLGKVDTSPSDIAAQLLLPDELVKSTSPSGIVEFRKWAKKSIEDHGGLVTFEDYWSHTKMPLPSKVYKKEIELMQNLAQKSGYGIAPDSRYHHAKPDIDGKLVLFAEGHGQYFEPSRAFGETGMALRLGAMVAAIDSHIDQAESTILLQLIDHDTRLSPTEKRSLHAYFLWRLNTKPNITGLKARLEKLGDKEKSTVSNILIEVALADGKIDPEEIKQLEKLYTALGLNKSLVVSDIHTASSGKAARSHSTSQQTTTTLSSGQKPIFTLDESILAIHESETKDVQTMLGAIFVDDELDDHTSEGETEHSENADVDGLDNSHFRLFESLISKEKWPRNDVETMCRNLGLMVDGALETINDWSYDKVGTSVVEEDGDEIYVTQEIVEELEG
ncbi:MAG: TerB N-terminal domain-containing protein [Proteobacteria bacterium]|nr:TerB N-terminal domain-containing protein [Pseudomonadota bacterium]